MISNLKLPFGFDPESLQADLADIHSDEWFAHFNKGYFEGHWSGVVLRSADGRANHLYPAAHAKAPFVDTPILARCPNVRRVVTSFKCPLRSVRFLKLAAGSTIKEHRDFDLGFKEGQLRMHIPVCTNADVDFFLDGHPIEMNEGECWYLDLSLPHWIKNRGATDRIHLVIDCELNDWLGGLVQITELKQAESIEECQSSPDELERFRQAVLGDLNLQARLRQTDDRESFVRLVVSTARERGYLFAARDAEDALLAAQQDRFHRWID